MQAFDHKMKPEKGWNALVYAAFNEDSVMFKMLLLRGARLESILEVRVIPSLLLHEIIVMEISSTLNQQFDRALLFSSLLQLFMILFRMQSDSGPSFQLVSANKVRGIGMVLDAGICITAENHVSVHSRKPSGEITL